MSASSSEPEKPSPIYDDATQTRQHPSFAELRRPGYLIKWLWAFFEGWFLSRKYQQLAIGLPFLLVAIGGPMFVWWLKSAPRDSLVAAYELAVEASIKNNEPEKTGVYLESLVGLRKLRKEYRHQLAMHYVEQEQSEKAGRHVSILVGTDGYVPTRLWLLKQAAEPDPVFPLTEEGIDRQLFAVLKKQPVNLLANWQMAERLMQKEQFKTAEDHLLRIVEQVPQLGLPLAQVQIQLQRGREQILSHLDFADQAFHEALIANNKDVTSRVRRAEIMLLKNDLSGALELILEGRHLEDDQVLRASNSKLLAMEARRKLSQSALNAGAAAQDLIQAIQLNPQDQSLLGVALSLNRLGVKWDAAQLQPAVDALVEKTDLTDADRQLLLVALASTGQNQRALEIINQIPEPSVASRVQKAEILLRAGNQKDADALLSELMTQTSADVSASSVNVDQCLNHARVLILQDRHQDAYDFIGSSLVKFAESDSGRIAEWQALFADANLVVFQKRLKDGSFQTADEVVKMLMDSRQGTVSVVNVLRRMIAVMDLRREFEPAIRVHLVQLARRSRAGWQVYNMLGTYDLQKSEQDSERLPGALKFLKLAYQSQKSDPMIMNNLAIALVRSNEDLPQARELVEEAITQLSDPVDALSTRAEISVAEGLWKDARTDLEAALAARPNSANVRRLLVDVMTQLGQPDLAEEHQAVYDQLTAPRKVEAGQGE
ncbi:MAG: hypothetical protein ABJZ55_24900 [Fuerstiella sp.]